MDSWICIEGVEIKLVIHWQFVIVIEVHMVFCFYFVVVCLIPTKSYCFLALDRKEVAKGCIASAFILFLFLIYTPDDPDGTYQSNQPQDESEAPTYFENALLPVFHPLNLVQSTSSISIIVTIIIDDLLCHLTVKRHICV